MRRYLLDTGIVQDFLNDRNGVRERADLERHQGHRLGICTPVLGELWAGVEGSIHRERNLKRLVHGLARLTIWPFDNEAAAQYGRIFTELKQRGRPIQQVDMQIAAIALTLKDCTVVTKDGDFIIIPHLSLDNWATSDHS